MEKVYYLLSLYETTFKSKTNFSSDMHFVISGEFHILVMISLEYINQ